MQYDPVKNIIMGFIRRFPFLRKPFFLFLDFLFLRQWYVKKHIKALYPYDYNLNFYDAGAGFCQYSDFVLSNWKKSRVLALDLKRDYLMEYAFYADIKYDARFHWIEADLIEHIPNERFNLIVAIDILEHIEEDLKVIKNFFQCLHEGGNLIISTPSNSDKAAQFTAEHVRPGYSEDDIKSKLTSSGFAIKEFKYTYGKWGKISWILSIKIPLKLLSLSCFMLIVLPIYYLCLYPIIYLLMQIDIRTINKIGNGIVIVAEKPVSAS